MKDFSSAWINQEPVNLKKWPEGAIVCSDALDLLRSLQSEIADIVFLDPPFNLGKKYGSRSKGADLLSDDEYTDFMEKVLSESIRVLKAGGALYIYHIPQWAIRFGGFLDKKLSFRHWISVSMKSGFVRGDFLYPAHYALMYFTKGQPGVFHRPKISPQVCRHCGEYLKDYGGYKKFVSNGINLSDVWEDLSPVRHNKYKNRSANELPIELIRRVVQISGEVGGILVDPFVGSGTSIIAAVEFGMQFLTGDREPSSCDVAEQRFSEFMQSS